MSDPFVQIKREITECENQTNAIKGLIRGLGQPSADGEEEEANFLKVTLVKTTGLPETAQPSVSLQLSSPIEEAALTKVFDESAEDTSEMVAVFRGVETNQATLSLSATDADIVLGDGKDPIDVSQLTDFDPMVSQPDYKSEVTVPIMPPDSDAGADPICRVYLLISYVPSKKDKLEKLYELINTVTHRKAEAVTKLRQAVAMQSRQPVDPSSSSSPRKPAVKPGFLNKGTPPQPSWISRNLGPESFVGRAVPVAKNYVLFVSIVGFFHFKGQAFALLPPV